MKTNLLLAFLLVATTFVACNRKSVSKTQQNPAPPPVEAPENDTPLEGETSGEEKVYQFLGFKKTPCYGTCPVYEVKIFSDGQVTWHGKRNVERTGWYESRVSREVLNQIREKVFEADFLALENQYPVSEPKVADLPSTITYVRIGDMEKFVTNTHDAPEQLLTFEQYLQNLIDGLAWTPAQGKD